MKRVRVYNKEELLYAIKFYLKLKPNSKLKLAEFDFDERLYKQGISVGYEEEENDSVYLFLSRPDDLESISMLGGRGRNDKGWRFSSWQKGRKWN